MIQTVFDQIEQSVDNISLSCIKDYNKLHKNVSSVKEHYLLFGKDCIIKTLNIIKKKILHEALLNQYPILAKDSELYSVDVVGLCIDGTWKQTYYDYKNNEWRFPTSCEYDDNYKMTIIQWFYVEDLIECNND